MSLFDEQAMRRLVEDAVRRVVREELAAQREPKKQGQGYVSIQAAADHAGVAPATIRRWIGSGKLPARKAGRVWRVRIEDLEAFLARPEAEQDGVIDMRKRAEELIKKAH